MLIEEPSPGWAERTRKVVSTKQETEIMEVRHTDGIVAQTTFSRVERATRQECAETETETALSQTRVLAPRPGR